MIIICNNCRKNFEIDSNLIPDSGRLLQCSSCNHKWFFQKEITKKPITIGKISTIKKESKSLTVNEPTEETEPVEIVSIETIELLEKVKKNDTVVKEISIKDENNKDTKINSIKSKKNYNILGLTTIFIISFIALIIILDTFQNPISKFFPNIEFLLYNLYETINDFTLFISDLI